MAETTLVARLERELAAIADSMGLAHPITVAFHALIHALDGDLTDREKADSMNDQAGS